MRTKLLEHALSVVLVTLIFAVLAVFLRTREGSRAASQQAAVEQYTRLEYLNFGDQLHRALFRESLRAFSSSGAEDPDTALRRIDAYRMERMTNPEFKTGGEGSGLTAAVFARLLGMYGQFILVFAIVMFLTYRAAQSLAIFRFVKFKQGRSSYLQELLQRYMAGQEAGVQRKYTASMALMGKAFLRGCAYAVLFAPAYVVGYAVRSVFNTESVVFLIVLAVISNGVLMNAANKLYTLLLAESRKGYVQAAVVRNLDSSFSWGKHKGISFSALIRPMHQFPSHVFGHIFLNARFQNILSLREQASFLITGLIIIEMALNIQGHLGYELLQDLLYRRYEIAMCILAGIFFLVKGTEILIDVWFYRESRKYENRSGS